MLAVSTALVSLSVFLPVTVHNRTELQNVKLGFPLSFIIQSQVGLPYGWYDAPPFPVRQALLSPWEHPLQVIWWRYILDIAMMFIALNVVYFITQVFRKRLQPGK